MKFRKVKEMSMIEKRLQELGYELPEVHTPMGLYIPVNRVDHLVYTSGQGSLQHRGKIGKDFTIEQGQEAARYCMLQCLACIKKEIGDLDKIDKVFKVLGFVNSAPGFNQQPQIINGASQLLLDVLGERGRHARSAIGSNELPGDVAVEIEMIVALKKE